MPEPTAVQRSDRRWTIRFRPADRFDGVTCPEWAQRIAREHCRRAHVRLGNVAGSAQLVEVVAVSRFDLPHREDAVAAATRIVEAIEG